MMTPFELPEKDVRLNKLCDWTTQVLEPVTHIQPVSGDASFRRYFRMTLASGRQVVGVDAPPEHEDCQAFVHIQTQLKEIGVRVPEIYRYDLTDGFMTLEDLGDTTLFVVLNEENVDHWYQQALAMAIRMACTRPKRSIAPFDADKMLAEMQLFTNWLLERHLGLRLSNRQRQWLNDHFEQLIHSIQQQPKGLVHRDFHSRNLMVTHNKKLATIDFQDAVIGPVTYDLVSLIKDCYVQWPEALRDQWCEAFRCQLAESGVKVPSSDEFIFWVDTMGIQRHLKAAGIFARLWHRDGKSGYLKDIPRTLSYITEAGVRHHTWRSLGDWIGQAVLPRLQEVDAAL